MQTQWNTIKVNSLWGNIKVSFKHQWIHLELTSGLVWGWIYLLFLIQHVWGRWSVFLKKQGILNNFAWNPGWSLLLRHMNIPGLYDCCMLVHRKSLEKDFRRIFQNSQNISCPLTASTKTKWSSASSRLVVLGIASDPCCDNGRSAFLQILGWVVISHYILRGKRNHQQRITLNTYAYPPHIA